MISVCMATYNGEKFIKEQLKSILQQLGDKDEVIVSDDGSSDKTLEIIKSFNDDRVIIFKNAFKNLVLNFEFALMQAKGDYIFLSDQDDVWLPNKIKVCTENLRSFSLVVSNCKVVDQDLQIINNSFFELNNSKKGLLSNVFKNSYLGCCLAFRNEVLQTALPFPKSIPMHDIWLGFVAELYFKSKFIEEPLLLYRRHGKNESPTAENSPYSLFQKFKFRFDIIKNLPILLKRRTQSHH
ncbi:glycosyltransferase family 2 protein [Flavobacterium sp. TMP13]|uniref:glycosyltransferase family 2 protein n=1 Tax=Flavobacterium sp. TMP13 TaxID=3425950 RepID=UPI003D77F79D